MSAVKQPDSYDVSKPKLALLPRGLAVKCVEGPVEGLVIPQPDPFDT